MILVFGLEWLFFGQFLNPKNIVVLIKHDTAIVSNLLNLKRDETLRVLFVYSGNASDVSPFIKDQADALEKSGIIVFYLPIVGRGVVGYLNNITRLRNYLKKNDIDLIHAHYGLSGLVASFQCRKPLVTTFHGSDINMKKVRPLSKLAAKLSDVAIYVSEELRILGGKQSNSTVIPCGIDMEIFSENRITKNDDIKILFSSSFDREVKNYPLAKKAIEIVERKMSLKVELLELKGYKRHEVANLMNEVNLTLLTSFYEGSPQVIKEAMACGCPAVSTNVGDVKYLFGDVSGYYITEYTSEDIAEKIIKAIKYSQQNISTHGRKRIQRLGLDSKNIAKKIMKIYKDILV